MTSARRALAGPAPAGSGSRSAVGLGVAWLLVLWLLVLDAPAHAQGVQLDTAGAGTEVGLRAARVLNHMAMALTVGLLLVPAWLLRGRAVATDDGSPRRAARLAAWSALGWAVTAVALFAFGVSNAAARPLPEALDADLARRFLDTRFGFAIAAQGAAAILVAALALLAGSRAGARSGLLAVAALAGALLLGVAPAWWGHAGTADVGLIAVGNAWLHIAAASLWVGGLAAVTAVVVRAGREVVAGPVARYSTLASVALVGVLATGVVNTAIHVSTPGLLLDTTWGRLAVAKAVLLAAIGAMGYLHRRRSIPALHRAGAEGRHLFRRIAAFELLLMLVVFGLASTMSSGMPADAEAASRIQAVRTALGDGQVEMTLDPARVGRNELHLYLYDDQGALLPVESASLRLSGPTETIDATLVPSGPGHYTGFGIELVEPGPHRIAIEAVHDGQTLTATSTVQVR